MVMSGVSYNFCGELKKQKLFCGWYFVYPGINFPPHSVRILKYIIGLS